MGKSTPSAPTPVNYTQAAADQGAANLKSGLQTAGLSNPNIISPYGNQNVTFDTTTNPDMPQATVTQTLTPAAQKTLEAQQQVQLSLANLGQQGATTASNVLGTPFKYSGPDIQTSLGPQRSIDYGPSAGMYGMAGGGPAANAYGLSGGGPAADAYGLAGGGPAGDAFGLAAGGPAANAYGLAEGIDAAKYGMAQRSLDLSGIAQMPVNAGMTGQAAILSRLQPQIQQEQAALNQQLANQGITPGSEAYNNAMRTQGQQANDLYTQAALQGINLDTAANQQGYGQALSTAGLYNAGLGQDINSALAARGLTNASVSQNFGQGQAAQQLQNQSIGQNFSQAQAAQAMLNASIGQNFGQGQAAQGMQNASIGQNFGQGQASQQLQNQSIGQNFGQGQAAAGLYNQAQNQGYNQNLQGAQFGNTAAQQSLAQQLQLRNQPLNEISALMSGSQIQNPQFQGYTGSNVAAAPVFQGAQAGGQQAMDIYGQQMAARNANVAALGQVAGSVAGLAAAPMTGGGSLAGNLFKSDIRLKSNIVRIGDHPLGIGVYEYDIDGHRDWGVMAQEVLTVKPEAVLQHPDGYLMVNYGAL